MAKLGYNKLCTKKKTCMPLVLTCCCKVLLNLESAAQGWIYWWILMLQVQVHSPKLFMMTIFGPSASNGMECLAQDFTKEALH